MVAMDADRNSAWSVTHSNDERCIGYANIVDILVLVGLNITGMGKGV